VIIDFRDRFNVVLAKHHRLRKEMFDSLNIPVYYGKTIENIAEIIKNFSEANSHT